MTTTTTTWKFEAIEAVSAEKRDPMSGDANPTKDDHSSKPNREEGELSSSDDDENQVCTTAVSPAPTLLIPPFVTQPEGPVSGNNLTSTTNIQTHLTAKPMKQTSDEKIQVVKSANPGWHAQSGGCDNLVIRFSDDESGSDSEEHKREKPRETKSYSYVVDGSQKPSALSAARLKIPGQTATKATKIMPKQGPLNHTFISSTAKVKGAANYRSTKPSLFDHVPRTQYLNLHSKNSASLDRGHDQGLVLNHSELQDLREQIALRETELKLKAARQSRELVSNSSKNANVLRPRNDAHRTVAVASAGPTEPEEPAKKRLKLNAYGNHDSSHSKQGMPPLKSNLVSNDSELENSDPQSLEMAGQTQRVIPRSKKELPAVTQQRKNDILANVSPGDIPDAVLGGPDRQANWTQSRRTSPQVDPCVSAKETILPANTSDGTLAKDMDAVRSKHPTENGLLNQQSSLTSKARRELDIPRSNGQDVRSGNCRIKPLSNKYQVRNKISPWRCAGNASLSSLDNMDIQSLNEMEDKIDRELEEAQEQRHICEIEERKALKAYRKAQRALIEANARCRDLYRQRELCSARFSSFLLDDSSLLFLSANDANTRSEVNASDIVPENQEFVSIPRHHFRQDTADVDRVEADPNVQCANAGPHLTSYEHYNRLNVGLDQCGEPDVSTSELLPHYVMSGANGVRTPLSDPITSADVDEETSEMHNDDSVEPSVEDHQRKQNLGVEQNKVDGGKVCDSECEDPLLLEATLRSELYARLGPRMFSRTIGSGCNLDPAVEKDRENGFENEKNQAASKGESEEQCYIQKDSLSSLNSLICSPLALRSTFSASREVLAKSCLSNTQEEEGAHIFSSEVWQGDQIINSVEETFQCLSRNGIASSCTEDHSVDPFWPLCMFELRGKCNNDGCPFQHIQDFSKGKLLQHQQEDTDTHGYHTEAGSDLRKCNSSTSSSKCDILPSPTYLVGFQILKADPRSKMSAVVWRSSQCWSKCFSSYLAVSIVPQNDVVGDEPFLDGNDGRIEIIGSWRDSSYFQRRTGTANKFNQAAGTDTRTLEMAILVLNQEPDKLTGAKKALCALSRALEVDPSSESLWIVYLLLCYSNAQFIGNHDMFLHAVKHNEQSYGLWLLYINNRKHLNDRLAAYEDALSILCHHSVTSGKDTIALSSGCILDLFLQMMDCLCISENVEKAIHKIYGLLPATTNSDEPYPTMLNDILSCLTVSDTCIFWVSCVYLVIYRKLPAAIVQQFECVKELLPVDWSSVHLPDTERLKAMRLLEMAANSVESYCSSEMLESDVDRKSAQQFALSHIRCMVALDDLGGGLNLLEKYVKLHPTCVELVLIAARLREDGHADACLVGFEEAIHSWPKDTSGVQCIWNQYTEFALRKGRMDFVNGLMGQWYDSLQKVQYSQNENSDVWGSENLSGLLDYGTSPKQELPLGSDRIDLMFGLLNLALHKVLQKDPVEGRKSIDNALRAAGPECLGHCMREHAIFLLSESKDAATTWQLSQLKAYLDAVRSFPFIQPLSRQFISGIENPRVQQLLTGLLSPVTSNAALLNLVLEVWNGPSLLPLKSTNSKDFVDFVEAVLELVPCNYELAFSACKLLHDGYNFGDVSSTSLLFWSSSILVDAIFRAVPVPPEYVWAEAADVLCKSTYIEAILERFFRKALLAHPFSLKLWQSYGNLRKAKGDQTIIDAARRRGLRLDPS